MALYLGYILINYFVLVQGKKVRDMMRQKLATHINNVYYKRDFNWIVIFPEGIFFRKGKEMSLR